MSLNCWENKASTKNSIPCENIFLKQRLKEFTTSRSTLKELFLKVRGKNDNK
jgi:hypothetical protein